MIDTFFSLIVLLWRETLGLFYIMLRILLVESYHFINVINFIVQYDVWCLVFLSGKKIKWNETFQIFKMTERLIFMWNHIAHLSSLRSTTGLVRKCTLIFLVMCRLLEWYPDGLLLLWSWARCPGLPPSCQKGRIEEIRFAWWNHFFQQKSVICVLSLDSLRSFQWNIADL